MTSKLFQPFDAKGLHFKNRIIHEPTTLNMSDPQGYATRRLAAAYGSLAAGGYSAVIVGATCVRRDGLINERMLGLYDEDYVIEFRDTVAEIKNNGSLAGIQLFYGGLIPGLGTTIPLPPGKGWIPGTVAWGPSNAYVIGNASSGVVPTEEYDDIVECFAQAGRRAKEAGFDFLSFHFCHGSLPHTNLSLLSNQGRTDKYADRFYMCEAIIQRTQELCGKDFPIVPRLCVDENLEGGYDIEYFAEHYAPRLHALGIAVLDCTFGSMLGAPSRRPDVHSTEFIGPSFYSAKVINKSNIQTLRAALQKRGIDMPLIGSANLITPDHLRTMVDEAGADFAGVCRLSLDDPVTRYLPFFTMRAPDGSTPDITIRHLLTHTSGIAYDRIPDDVTRGSDPQPLFPLEENLRRLARGELAFKPGENWAYGMSIDVLGGVLGAISGNISDVEAALRTYVLDPLGLTDTRFAVTDAATGEVVESGRASFTASGRTYSFLGFLAAYVESRDEGEGDDEQARLPQLESGAALLPEKLTAEAHETRPPSR